LILGDKYHFFFLLGYGNYPAVFKGDITGQMAPECGVHYAGNFHAFDHFTVG
jgi:hypothetical protein